jgi:crotonobetainyl-CoA:carnitine CoA-transferase CaiB-like acyl-CoA transferase
MKPLDGVRVLDLGTFIAGPYCATIFAEFGAEVIKIEPPKEGDSLRRFGTATECGDTLVWLSESRNKKCITLDLKSPRGIGIFKELVRKSDVVIENFRSGVMEKLELSYEELSAINPKIVMVRISAYGQTGPYREKPGFARVAHAFAGLSYLSGEPGRQPVTPGSSSLADYGSGLYGAIGALLALRVSEKTGKGQCIDIGLYESIFRLLDEIVPAYEKSGFVRERMGADTVNVAPHSHYPTADGKWVAIACSNDKIFMRLAQAMNQPELAEKDRFGTTKARTSAVEEINKIVSSWTSSLSALEVVAACDAASVPASLLNSIADIFADPQYQARQNIIKVPSRAGNISVPNVVPRLSETPGEIHWLGESLGKHTEEIMKEIIGLDSEAVDQLRKDNVI